MNKLSITSTDDGIEIKTNNADIAATLIKGIIGVAPIVGPIIAETLSATIPNQKIARVIACIMRISVIVSSDSGTIVSRRFG